MGVGYSLYKRRQPWTIVGSNMKEIALIDPKQMFYPVMILPLKKIVRKMNC